MAGFLVKKCIKDYGQTENPKVRASYGILGSVVGIFCNLALFVLKFIVGMLTGSMAVTADAFNNLSDMTSSVISLFGARASSRPADRDHPFGHGRIEYIAALIISVAIINVGISFFRDSITKIIHPEAINFSLTALLILLASVGVKLWMAAFNRSLAKDIHSEVLRATSVDSLFDAITTSATIASLLIYRITGINIDGITGMVVSVLVIWTGIGIARDTFSPLIGQKMDPETEEKIKELVESDPAVISTHDLIIHSYGPSSNMATIHIEVSSRMTLREAHAIADKAERRVMQQLGISLVVHVDPVDFEDERAIRIRGQLTRILKILDDELTFHDLQITFGDEETIISFDLVVPYKYTAKDEDRVMYQIISFMRELDPKNHCIIIIDRGIMEEARMPAG